MEIRFAEKTEKNILKNIWKTVFNEDEFYLSYKFENFITQNTVVACVNEKIVGMVHFEPCTMSDNSLAAYLNGVSVLEEYRNKNLASEMLNFLHGYLKENNFSFCFLKPAISNFYEKFGYKTAINVPQITENLPYCKYTLCNFGHKEIFNQKCFDSDLYLNRTKESFKQIISLYHDYNGDILCFRDENEFAGYIIYYKDNNKIIVEESVSLKDDFLNNIKAYFNEDLKINELPIMVKELKDKFSYNKPFIKVI